MTHARSKVLAVLVVLSGFCACKDKPAEAPVAPPPPRVEAPSIPTAPVGQGAVAGQVALIGTPPVMEPIKRGSEPACSVTLSDESALVKGGKIQNVVVRIKGGPNMPPPATPVEIDQRECMYRPRVFAAVAGQELIVRNTDGAMHNVHTYLGSRTLRNQAQPAGSPPLMEKFSDGPGLVKFACDVHPWMRGYAMVSNNGYFAVTGPDGKFEIKGIPAGQYTLETWHEKFGMKAQPVTITADKTSQVSLTYSADDRG